MGKITSAQNAFTMGEVSLRALGQFSEQKPIWKLAAARVENFLVYQLGGALYRPGSQYAGVVKNSSWKTRLLKFIYSTSIKYAIEAGPNYMRFWANGGQVVVPVSAPIDANSVFLSHFNVSPFVDEIGHTISNTGVTLDTANYEFGPASANFNGSAYMAIPASSDFNFGTGDFTIDGWVYIASTTGGLDSFCGMDDTYYNTGAFFFARNAGSMLFRVCISAGSVVSVAGPSVALGGWHHLAVVRSGTTVTVYVDGVGGTPATFAGQVGQSVNSFWIGVSEYAGYAYNLTGNIDELRVSKGIARWASNFTPPTAPYGGPAAWQTSTVYVVGNYVTQSSTVYLCLKNHTSGTFATDLAAGDWTAQSLVEIVTPYGGSDLQNLQSAGKGDVLYIVDGGHQQQKLSRVSATQFNIAPVQTIGGPFLDYNTDVNTTITPNSATGATTLTATVPAWGTGNLYVPGDWCTSGGVTYQCLVSNLAGVFAADLASGYWVQTNFFRSGHVGALYKVGANATTFGCVIIATVATNGLSATGKVQSTPAGAAGNLGTTSATAYWAEGAFSDDRGWPASVVFHEQRLVYGGPGDFIYGSAVGAYDDFSIGATLGTDAYVYELSSDNVATVRWLSSNTTLQVGTNGGTYTAQSSTGGVGITPTSIAVTQDTDYSVQQIPPVKIGGYLYYIQGNSYNQRTLVFDLYQNKQVGDDVTLLADHILRDGGGAYQMDKQSSPNDRIWVVRNDGQMAVLTRNTAQQIMAWCRLVAGSTATGPGLFESVCVLPNDGGDDTIWVIVNRNINGTVTRCVEYFTAELFTNYYDPINVDCSLSINVPITISGITKANPGVITTPTAHGLTNAQRVKIDSVLGMTQLNTNQYLVANATTYTFTLTDLLGAPVDTTFYSTYLSGGQARLMFTSISGLSYLNGEAVSVQADGNLQTTYQYLVSGGAITLATPAAVVHVGLPYTGYLQLLPSGGGSQSGPGQAKLRKTYAAAIRFFKSLGGKIGFVDQYGNVTGLIDVAYSSVVGYTAGLYTGDVTEIPNADVTRWDSFLIKQDKPLPMMILAVMLTSESQEV